MLGFSILALKVINMNNLIIDRVRRLNLDKNRERAVLDIITALKVSDSNLPQNALLLVQENKKAIDVLNGDGVGSVNYKIRQAFNCEEINN